MTKLQYLYNMNNKLIAAQQQNINYECQLEFNNKVASELGQSVNHVVTFMLSKLEEAGYKYSTFIFGRDIDRKHCQDLYKALNKKGKTQFTKRAVAMSAKVVLEANKMVESKNQIRIYDYDTNELTLESPDIEKYLVYLDGNHRWFVHHLHPEIDLEVEFAVVTDPFEFMADFNSLSSNWSLKDWIHAQTQVGRIDGTVHSDISYVEEHLCVSMKYAHYLLSRNRECVKKSDLENGKDTTLYNPEFVKRGMILARTIAAVFPKPAKDAPELEKQLFKAVRTLQFLDAIEYVEKSKPTNFAPQFSAFLVGLTENDRQVIYHHLSEKDYNKLNSSMEKTYAAFLKAHEHDLDIVIKNAETETLQVFSKPEESNKPQTLKSGVAKVLADSIQGVAAYEKAEKALKKAVKAVVTAQKAFDKATTDLLNVEQNYQKAVGSKKEEQAEKKLSTAQENYNKAENLLTTAKVALEKAKTEFDAIKAVKA